MSTHPAAWHDRQLAHVRACIVEADKRHSAEEIALAWSALSEAPACPQASMFQTKPTRTTAPEASV